MVEVEIVSPSLKLRQPPAVRVGSSIAVLKTAAKVLKYDAGEMDGETNDKPGLP